MTEHVHPSVFKGTVAAPPSKSHLQRAIAIASLCDGESLIKGYAPSADVDAAISAVRSLGADVTIHGSTLRISRGRMLQQTATVHCGESGLAARMMAAIAALSEEEITVTGEGSLLKRPFGMVHDALSQLGKKVELDNGLLPMELSGTLRPAEIRIDGSESSQLLTGLLIALPHLHGDSVIHVSNLKSRPYVQMTIDTLQQFGIVIHNHDFIRFDIAGNQVPRAHELLTEGDWSGAAFLLVAAAVAGRATVTGLNPTSAQADRAVLDALQAVGADVKIQADSITVSRAQLQPFRFDASDCPDLFPPLAALAANCPGTSTILGISRLRGKESDRAQTISAVLRAAGIHVQSEDDAMHITGGKINGCPVSSFNDHRIAMMSTVLALNADGAVTISEAEAVNKSYPAFFRDMASLTRTT